MARPFKICPDCGAHLDASEPCDCKDAIEREPPKPWERLKLLAVCREVDKESGRVSVYPLDLEITSEILASLKMRAQFNPELRYFTTTTARWDRYVQQAVKHVLVVNPKKFAPGKLAPASSAEASGEYPVTYYATYIDGKKVLEIDILNFIYYVNGVDYLEDVRKALGK